MDEEMKDTLYQVAKMRAEFNLLKDAIMNSFALDYTGDRLRIADDRLIIQVMETIEPDDMIGILANLKEEMKSKEDINNG